MSFVRNPLTALQVYHSKTFEEGVTNIGRTLVTDEFLYCPHLSAQPLPPVGLIQAYLAQVGHLSYGMAFTENVRNNHTLAQDSSSSMTPEERHKFLKLDIQRLEREINTIHSEWKLLQESFQKGIRIAIISNKIKNYEAPQYSFLGEILLKTSEPPSLFLPREYNQQLRNHYSRGRGRGRGGRFRGRGGRFRGRGAYRGRSRFQPHSQVRIPMGPTVGAQVVAPPLQSILEAINWNELGESLAQIKATPPAKPPIMEPRNDTHDVDNLANMEMCLAHIKNSSSHSSPPPCVGVGSPTSQHSSPVNLSKKKGNRVYSEKEKKLVNKLAERFLHLSEHSRLSKLAAALYRYDPFSSLSASQTQSLTSEVREILASKLDDMEATIREELHVFTSQTSPPPIQISIPVPIPKKKPKIQTTEVDFSSGEEEEEEKPSSILHEDVEKMEQEIASSVSDGEGYDSCGSNCSKCD